MKNGIILDDNFDIWYSTMQGFIEKCEVLLKDSQKSQNQKNDSDLPLIQIPKLKIRR